MPGDVTELGSGRRASDSSRSRRDPPTAVLGPTDEIGVPAPAVGSSVGRYVVLEEVGRGGMGRVLRAYDPKLQREVALKEVRAEVLGRTGAQRLVAEARAMAKVSHANVVAVYDVDEVADDRLVLVMEFVAGQTLATWLEQRRQPWRQIIERFLQAGQGLAAAHAAGLLHRDFKPSNVLVAEGVVKVTDFGLAKLGSPDTASLGGDDAPRPSGLGAEGLTEAGVVMGTPRYMAPEQHRGDALTEAADQYAFCVALWEALCGKTPFGDDGGLPAKIAGPPPWPGGPTPRPVVDALRRGLSGDPAQRWPSMDALLDVLRDDPGRRRGRWLGAAAGVTVVGLGLLALQAWSAARAERCSEEAARAHLVDAWDEPRRAAVHDAVLGIDAPYAASVWERTEQVLDAYAASWTRMHVQTCEATTVSGEQSTAVMDLRMACLHRAKVDLAAVTAVLADADPVTVQKAHELTGDMRPLERCADVDALQAAVEPPLGREAEAVEAIRGYLATARAVRTAGHFDAAREAVEAARLGAADVDYGPVQTEVALAEATMYDDQGDYAAAETSLQRTLELASKRRQWEFMQTAASQLLYIVGYRQRRFQEGLRYAEVARGLAEGDPRREATATQNLAAILYGEGKYTEAVAEQRRALALIQEGYGKDSPQAAMSRGNLAAALLKQGKPSEAEAEQRRALAIREAALGDGHPAVYQSHANLAGALFARGEYAAAEAEQRRAIAGLEEALGPDHPDVVQHHGNFALILKAQGKYADAEAENRLALAGLERSLGPDHPAVATSRSNLGVILHGAGRLEEAEAEFRRALRALTSRQEQGLSPDHPHIADCRSNLGAVLHAQGRLEEAEKELRAALEVRERTLDPDHPETAATRSELAAVLVDQGKDDEARASAEAAWNRLQRDDVPARRRADAAFVLARASWAGGDPADRTRARELAQVALASYADAQRPDSVEEVQKWLADHTIGSQARRSSTAPAQPR